VTQSGIELATKFETNIFRKSVEEIKMSLKSDKINGKFLWPLLLHLWQYISYSYLEWQMFRIRVVEKINPYPANVENRVRS